MELQLRNLNKDTKKNLKMQGKLYDFATFLKEISGMYC
jgi:hypothetical protein